MKPDIVYLGKLEVPDPPDPAFREKCELLQRHVDATMIATGSAGVSRVRGVRVVRLPTVRRVPVAGSLLFYVIGPLLAVALARRRRVIVCKSPYEGMVTLLAAALLPCVWRPRVVIEVHGDWTTATRLYGRSSRRLLAPLLDWAASHAVRRADRIRVVGRFTERRVRSAGFIGRIDRHHAFLDLEAFLRIPPAPFPEERRAAYIGALEAVKGPDVLIRAFDGVRRELGDAKLVVVGEGTMRPQLEQLVGDLGLGERVTFTGRVDRDDVREVLDGSMCLVVPSRSEGLGRVVLEAMARARPVVASEVGGLVELVRPGHTGLLVQRHDPDGFATSICALLRDPRLARELGQRARNDAESLDPDLSFDAGTARLAAWAKKR